MKFKVIDSSGVSEIRHGSSMMMGYRNYVYRRIPEVDVGTPFHLVGSIQSLS